MQEKCKQSRLKRKLWSGFFLSDKLLNAPFLIKKGLKYPSYRSIILFEGRIILFIYFQIQGVFAVYNSLPAFKSIFVKAGGEGLLQVLFTERRFNYDDKSKDQA